MNNELFITWRKAVVVDFKGSLGRSEETQRNLIQDSK